MACSPVPRCSQSWQQQTAEWRRGSGVCETVESVVAWPPVAWRAVDSDNSDVSGRLARRWNRYADGLRTLCGQICDGIFLRRRSGPRLGRLRWWLHSTAVATCQSTVLVSTVVTSIARRQQPTPDQSLIGMVEPKCRQSASGTARAAHGTRIGATRLHNADRDPGQA